MVLNGDDLYPNRNVVLGNKKMRRGCLCSLFLATLVLALQGCASFYFHKAAFSPPPPRSLTLSDNPIREYWTGIVFNGSKIGFSHFRLASAAEEENRFDIQSEAYFRIRFLMLDKKINLRGFDRVADDLSLIRFDYAFDIDGNHLSLNGQRSANQLAVTVRSRGESTPQVISLETQDLSRQCHCALPVSSRAGSRPTVPLHGLRRADAETGACGPGDFGL